MVKRTKSRLQAAIANEKGIDYKKVVEKKKQKQALKRKQKTGKGGAKEEEKQRAAASDDEDDWVDDGEDEDEEDEEDEGGISNLIDGSAEETSDDDGEDEDDEDDDEDEMDGIDFSIVDNDVSSSDSEIEMEEKIQRPKPTSFPPTKAEKAAEKKKMEQAQKGKQKKAKKTEEEDAEKQGSEDEEEEDEEDEEDEEEDIALEDLEDLDPEEREDLVPHTRVTINNHTALIASLNRISLPADNSVPFATHQSVVSSKPTSEAIPDIQDDLQRELAFYAQCLEAARKGRSLLLREGVPFTRPNDYFAEMVKSDSQMDKVKAKLVEEATAKKAAAEARKLRDLKKFGKQVQVAKEQERAKQKRETLEKIKTLKKKRQEGSASALGAREADDLFDVAVDDELTRHDSRKRSAPGGSGGGPSTKRQKKNDKYGFGGKKRHAKSGDAVSSGDLSGFNPRRMKGKGAAKAPRPGKNRRKAAAART